MAPRISFGVEQDCDREGKRREVSAASLGSGAPMGVRERGDSSGRFLLMCFSCRDIKDLLGNLEVFIEVVVLGASTYPYL